MPLPLPSIFEHSPFSFCPLSGHSQLVARPAGDGQRWTLCHGRRAVQGEQWGSPSCTTGSASPFTDQTRPDQTCQPESVSVSTFTGSKVLLTSIMGILRGSALARDPPSRPYRPFNTKRLHRHRRAQLASPPSVDRAALFCRIKRPGRAAPRPPKPLQCRNPPYHSRHLHALLPGVSPCTALQTAPAASKMPQMPWFLPAPNFFPLPLWWQFWFLVESHGVIRGAGEILSRGFEAYSSAHVVLDSDNALVVVGILVSSLDQARGKNVHMYPVLAVQVCIVHCAAVPMRPIMRPSATPRSPESRICLRYI